jgi:hypothetical protein
MLTSPTQRAPTSSLVVPIVLGVILVPLSEIGVAFLGAPGGSLLPWLVGTPICYFLIGGLGAFTTVSGLVPARARSRGAWVGFVAGICGVCSAGLIVAAFAVWALAASPQSAALLHPQVGVAPHVFDAVFSGSSLRFPLIAIIVILLPIFLGVNLLGVGLAPLGGMLGGYLRALISPPATMIPEQTGGQAAAQSGRGVLVITIAAILLAVIVTIAGLLYFTGDFAASAG